MIYLLSYALSLLMGYLFCRLILAKEGKCSTGLFIVLASGLGLGISAEITFYSYVFFNKLLPVFVLSTHGVVLVILTLLNIPTFKNVKFTLNWGAIKNPFGFLIALLFAITLIPFWIQLNFYPLGGWDAWSCWNLKSRFLFLGGDQWKNMLDPILWRSSPHYPILLPLLNVWGWILSNYPTHTIPLTNALLFTLLTLGALFFGLKTYSNNLLAAIGVFLLSTLYFFVQLAASQYSDIIVAYFLLTGLICFLAGQNNKSAPMALISGLMLGFLSFSKSEGTVASLLAALIALTCLFIGQNAKNVQSKKLAVYFVVGLLLTALPTILFQILYAPANQTFINGFASATHPAGINRLKIIFGFLFLEIVSAKWNGIWLLLLAGLFLTKGKCLNAEMRIFPLFLVSYILIVCFYYFTNTYFEITWWLSVSLNRILFSILPVMVFWVFASLKENK